MKNYTVIFSGGRKDFKTINQAVQYYMFKTKETPVLYYKSIRCSMPPWQLKKEEYGVIRNEYFYNETVLLIKVRRLVRLRVPITLYIYDKVQEKYINDKHTIDKLLEQCYNTDVHG